MYAFVCNTHIDILVHLMARMVVYFSLVSGVESRPHTETKVFNDVLFCLVFVLLGKLDLIFCKNDATLS